MIFETLLQGKIFLCFVFFGGICGMVFSAKKLIDKSFKKRKFVVVTTDILFMIMFSLTFIFAKTMFAFGEFRLYLLIAYVLGIVWEQISLDFLVEKFLKMSYTLFGKIFCKLKKTKLFSKVLK